MAQQENQEPVQQSVHVDCPVEEAFELFTERFGEWWPKPDGRELGAVTVWDPPNRVAFSWNSDPDETVDVVFSREADGTLVTLTHSGWQNAGVEMSSIAASFAGFAIEQLVVLA